MNINKIKIPYRLRNNRDTANNYSSSAGSTSISSGGFSWLENYVSYDSENNSLIFTPNILSEGEVTAWTENSTSISIWDSMPIATDTVLGGVKVGSGLGIDGNGILTVTSVGTIQTLSLDSNILSISDGNSVNLSEYQTDLTGYALADWVSANFSSITHNHDSIYKPIAYVPTWTEITGKPTTFTPESHNHDSLYKPLSYVPDWSEITSKPATFTPSSHTHTISNVTSLQSSLDSKFDKSGGTISGDVDITGDLHLDGNITASGEIAAWMVGEIQSSILEGVTTIAPLSKSGSSLSFNYDTSQFEVISDQLQIKDGVLAPSAHTHVISDITSLQSTLDSKIPLTQKGTANGIAELDSNGIILSSQLPSFVDDVIEVSTYSSLPTTGESGKIYITTNDNKTYRYTGSGYAEISSSLALGETSGTAYRGDRGKTAYNYSQIGHLPLTGGTLTGGLTINSNLIVKGNNIGFIDGAYDAKIQVSDDNPNGTGAVFNFYGDGASRNATLSAEYFDGLAATASNIYQDTNPAGSTYRLLLGNASDTTGRVYNFTDLYWDAPTSTIQGANITGNASTATKLATARTISLTGDISGSTSFDGSGDASISATIANDSHTHKAENITSGQLGVTGQIALNNHPEGGALLSPSYENDLAFITERGGAVTSYYTTSTNYTAQTLVNAGSTGFSTTVPFDGTTNYTYNNVSSTTDIVVFDIVMPFNLSYTNTWYVDFGAPQWRAKDVSVYAYQTVNNAETTYKLVGSVTNNPYGLFFHKGGYNHVKASGGTGYNYNRLRFVMTNWYGTSTRLASIGAKYYNSSGLSTTLLNKGGGSIYGVISWSNTNDYGLDFQNYTYGTHLQIGGWQTTNSNDISRIRCSTGNLHLDSAANGTLYLNHYTSGNLGVNNGGGWLQVFGQGIDMNQQPIIDGHSITLSNGVYRSSHSRGHLVGSYNNIGANSTYTNPIYTIGSSYFPTDTTLDNMYGIGYTHGANASFVNMTGADSWGLYVASDGDARIFLNSSGGHISNTGNVYSSAFIKSGGTSSQFLKANGSVDSTSYLPLTGGTVSGNLTVSGDVITTEVRTSTGQALVLSAGESYAQASGQTNEYVYVNAESGLQISSSPDNWASGWAGRKTATICDTSGNSSFPNAITASGSITSSSDILCNTYFRSTDNAAVLGTASSGTVYLRPVAYNSGNSQSTFTSGLATIGTNMSVAGTITATSEVTAYSDRRLKDNLSVIPNALEKVESLTGYTYNRIDLESKKRYAGLIAQDVQAILPEAIVGEEILSINDSAITGLLVEAIKELKQEIEKLKKK